MALEPPFHESELWSRVGPDCTWPRGSVLEEAVYVKHGRMDNLPASPSQIVRIFLSSTFTDTYAERNLLIKEVYPRLKRECKQRFNLDFQVVDMRWGVRNEATVDHSAGALCMAEIANCLKYSVGPTFVALLSHRCGGRALPTCIPQQEMEHIIGAIKSWAEHSEKLSLVEKWYKLDENAIPPEYNLQPIVKYEDMEKSLKEPRQAFNYESDGYLRNLEEEDDEIDGIERLIEELYDGGGVVEEAKKVYKTLASQEKKVWSAEEPVLSRTIRQAVSLCVQTGTLTQENCHKYFQSITEEEVRRGLLEDPERSDHCLVFRRIITNINLQHKKAWRFIDMTDDNQVDAEAQGLLNHLRDVEVPEHLPKQNIFHYQVPWSDNEGINETDHAQYLEEFCGTFERAVMQLIERGVEKRQRLQAGGGEGQEGGIYSEVLEHSHQCVKRVENFHGREAELETIRRYIISTSDQPLVLQGESGCGKTSVLAKAATMIPQWIGDNRDVCVILRFLGTTLDSSTISRMLISIMQQIIDITGLHKKFPILPEEFTDIKNIFKELLAAIPPQKRVVIILDSLDQISGIKDINGLLWIPKKLEPQVKLMVSTIPEEHSILQRLKSANMKLNPSQFLAVHVMEGEAGRHVLQMWLQKEKRKLTASQTELLERLVNREVKPLYLKLIFDEISKWKSYQQPSFYCPNISTCLHRLFRKLEVKHGEMVVKHALGYLCASKNGLTNLEMEDILSLDEEVLTDVFEFHVPPIRRLPSILWARISHDLKDYIVERGADGVRVMAWYHRQLVQDAKRRYLTGKNGFEWGGEYERKNMHLYKVLMEYFSGIWGDEKEKPFKFTEFQRKKLGLSSNDGALPRYVPEQPSIYRQSNGSLDIENMKFNRRKISELPHACEAVMNNEDNTTFISKYVAFNQEFLTAWIGTTAWEDIVSFMNAVSRGNDYVPDSDNLSERLSNLQGNIIKNSDRDMLLRGTEGLALQMSALMQGLVLSYTSALNNPSYIGADISGRLLQLNNSLEGVDTWIAHTDNKGRELCALVPPHPHLEPPGGEQFYVLNNHKGPIWDAIWSPVDDELCISVSQKLVVSSIESGQIIQDTKPRSVPKGDYFCKVTALLTKHKKPLYIAILKKRPLLYVFTEEGEVLTMTDVSLHTKDKVEVSELKAFTCISSEAGSEDCVAVIDKTRNTVICLKGLTTDNVLCTHVGKVDTGKVTAAFIFNALHSEGPCGQSKILLLKENGIWELYNKDFEAKDQCQFQWPKVCSANEEANSLASPPNKLVLGFETGQVCVVSWDPNKTNLKHLNPLYLQDGSLVSRKTIDNGPVHYVSYHTKVKVNEEQPDTNNKAVINDKEGGQCSKAKSIEVDNENQDKSQDYGLGMAHTEKASYLFRIMYTATGHTDSTEESKQCLQVMWKRDVKYDFSVFSRQLQFVFAVQGGTVDVLKIKKMESTPEPHFSVTTFMTLAVHSDDITKILPLEDDVFFMTVSKDSSLKFLLLGRSRVSRRHKLHFDHTDRRITHIAGGQHTALTWAHNPRIIYQWDIVRGRIVKTFRHLNGANFIICATDAKMELLTALDREGSLYIWKLEDIHQPHIQEARSDTKSVPYSRRQAENPKPERIVKTSIPPEELAAPEQGTLQSLLVLPQNIVIFTVKGGNQAYIVTHDEGQFDTKMTYTTRAPLEYALSLSTGQFMFVSKNECGISKVTGRSLDHFYSMVGLLGQKAKIQDVKVTAHLGLMLFLLRDEVVLWKPGNKGRNGSIPLVNTAGSDQPQSTDNDDDSRKPQTLDEGVSPYNNPSVSDQNTSKSKKHKKSSSKTPRDRNSFTGDPCLLPSEGPVCVVLDKSTKQYAVLNIDSQRLLVSSRLSTRAPVEFCTITPDGLYLVYVSRERELYLLRLSDGRLLAWYTMYTPVCSLATSSDGWYVLVGTNDNRLFGLVIADPDEKTHDRRIEQARAANPPLEDHVIAQLMGNINDYNNYSPDMSDSEEDIDVRDEGEKEVIDRIQTVEDVMDTERNEENTGRDGEEEITDEDISDERDTEESNNEISASWAGENSRDYSVRCDTGEKIVKEGVLFTRAPCSLQ